VKRAVGDKRAERTRKALLQAFFGLIVERPYEEIKVGEIVTRAGVGRSTLYEHFPNKEAILAVSLDGPLSVLAEAVRLPPDVTRLTTLLVHFWTNRAMARSILAGPLRSRATSVLTQQVERHLRTPQTQHHTALIIPTRLAAIQLAEALLAPVAAWLAGESRCSPETLAFALGKTATALRHALSRPAA
jgi:AcrR family transcriptional regulator